MKNFCEPDGSSTNLPNHPARFDLRTGLPPSLEQVWTLLWVHPIESLRPVLTQKSAGGKTGKTKTDVVVAVVRIVPVAVSRATVPRIVVPGTASDQLGEPAPIAKIQASENKSWKWLGRF